MAKLQRSGTEAWHMTSPELRFNINLLPDMTVVTRDGEIIGTWDTDWTDAFYQFTPNGAAEPILMDPYRWKLCEQIEAWLADQDSKKPAG